MGQPAFRANTRAERVGYISLRGRTPDALAGHGAARLLTSEPAGRLRAFRPRLEYSAILLELRVFLIFCPHVSKKCYDAIPA